MIKNIIFDFGGVIYDIDHNLSKIAFEKLGVSDFDQLYGHQKQQHLFQQMERGALSEDEFRRSIREYLPKYVSDVEIDDAWSALLVGFDTDKIDLLREIKENYLVFLLSNTNSIHARRFLKELNAYTDFNSLFTDVWLSHEKGMRKPELSFYRALLDEYDLVPEETLFIDDLDVNIQAAKQIGMHTNYIKGSVSILDLFENGRLCFKTNAMK